MLSNGALRSRTRNSAHLLLPFSYTRFEVPWSTPLAPASATVHTTTCIFFIGGMVLLLAIEGNIGIGKSTLLANLKAHFAGDKRVAFVDEARQT
jgi:hypothetical protein